MDYGKRVYCSQHPLLQHKVTLLRDANTEPKKFRELIREISILLAYEATRDLSLREIPVTTPLATTTGYHTNEKVGLVPTNRPIEKQSRSLLHQDPSNDDFRPAGFPGNQ